MLCYHASCFTRYTSGDLSHIALSDITVIVNIIGNLTNVIQSATKHARQYVSTTKFVVIYVYTVVT